MFFDEELNNYIYSRGREINKHLENIKGFNHREEYFKVKKYLDDYLNGNLEKRFIVLPGLRGVGKTTILFQLYDYLINIKKINPKNLIYLSMDQVISYFDTDLLKVVDSFLEEIHTVDKINLQEKIFIFVDESHFDKKWAIAGKIIFDTTKNIFLIFTGSSALNLEITGDVARRIDKKPIFPLNFNEYLLLKHGISANCNFSKKLKDLIYFGKTKQMKEAIKCEDKVYDSLNSLNNNPQIEFDSFLKRQGFPFTLNFDVEESYKKIYSIVDNLIEKDIPSVKAFNSSTKDTIRRIILYIALQKPGGTSNAKIANYLSISPSLVREILDTLEKTQLLFHVKPYGGSSKIIKKQWQYFFLSPSLKTAINFEIGRYNLNNRKCLGLLAENLVASSLYKMSKTDFNLLGLFYPAKKGSSDFLIKTKFDEIVPIEVGIGKKTKSQVKKDMNNYNSKYGILVSNRYPRIKYKKDIIYLPLMNFGFI
ncbi:MAG: AAA family ATPase [Methanobrevibacter sp.]|nr:AAA family ATPase [Methanobrevibacter sp.]